MTLPSNLKNHFEQILHENLNTRVIISRSVPLKSLSSFHQTYRLETNIGFIFLKLNFIQYKEHFVSERYGLETLSRFVSTPTVMATGSYLTYSYILLEWIDEAPLTRKLWYQTGADLAYLHNHTEHDGFGLEQDNFLGKLVQKNTLATNWVHFFIDYRLKPQLELAAKNNLIQVDLAKKFTVLFNKIGGIIHETQSVLNHGDMWGGNHMYSGSEIVFIDPAIYWAPKEVELSFTLLFNHFPKEFYEGYTYYNKLDDNWHSTSGIYNLYPLLIHLNTFGGAYLGKIKEILHYYT